MCRINILHKHTFSEFYNNYQIYKNCKCNYDVRGSLFNLSLSLYIRRRFFYVNSFYLDFFSL